MRLLTHNSLRCTAKAAIDGYPLKLEIEDMEVDETDYNESFMTNMIPQLDWNGVLEAARAVGFDGLPNIYDKSSLSDRDFLLAVHKLLMDIHVVEGTLTCPDTGKVFKIINGIPEMNIPEADA